VAGAATSLVSSTSSGLQDVIIGYRRPNTNQKQYLSRVLANVRSELQSKNFTEKRVAA